jgi:glyoxylase-like metal-dependent hydrolase (beta-lactamase superfamily II)
MKEVIPGIFQLSLPLPNLTLDHINTYLIRGDSQCLLVDTGWNTPELFDSLKEQLAEIGVQFADISQIVVTHVHADHYGMAGRLKQLSPAKIALHQIEMDLIESRYIAMEALLGQLAEWLDVNGVPDALLPELGNASLEMVQFVVPTMPDIVLHGGETIALDSFNFQVLWTPGHSPGHICLYEPQRNVLISGDHVLPRITPNIGMNPQSGPNPLGDFLNSLQTVKKLGVDLVLPGHEQPFANLNRRIGQLVRHHRERNSQILRTLDAGPKTAYQIARELTWGGDAGGMQWDSMDAWDKRMAVMETLAHLEEMRAEGRLDKFVRGENIHYQTSPITKGE